MGEPTLPATGPWKWSREACSTDGISGAPGLEYQLQVLVGLSSQLEITARALLRHSEKRRLPSGAEVRLAQEGESARRLKQWALTALAIANLPEGVRHG